MSIAVMDGWRRASGLPLGGGDTRSLAARDCENVSEIQIEGKHNSPLRDSGGRAHGSHGRKDAGNSAKSDC
jgi:hypothetical protein